VYAAGALARWLQKLLDVRPGEGLLALRATVVLFGLVSAHTMLETARDALFLEKLAAGRLPLVYALLAGLGLFAARGNTWFVARFGRRNTLIASLLVAAYGTVVLYRLPASRAMVFALYAWSALVGTLMVAQFWMLCGGIFTLGQSKRLFAPISSGGVLGAVAGAGAAFAIVRAAPVEQLLLVSAGIFLVTAFVLTTLRNDDAEVAPLAVAAPDDEDEAARRGGLIAEIRRWPYLGRLVGLIGVSTAAVLTADYLFKSTVARTLPAAELASFFATAYAAMNAVALVVQLVLAQYLVRRLGILAAFCVLPVLLVAGGAASVVLGGAVLATVLTKGADGALRHSLHRISTELLWLPLPEDVRGRVKTLVDTVVVRGVQALVAGVLLALAMLRLDGPIFIGGLIVALSCSWLVLAMALRRPYLALFRSALARRGGSDPRGELRLDLGSVELVVEALASPDPGRVIAAIDLLVTGKRDRLIPALILYHESPEVLVRALEALATPGRTDWLPLADRLMKHADESVRVAVVRALSQVGDLDEVAARFEDASPAVRGHAAFWLAERSGGPPDAHPAVAQVLRMADPEGAKARHSLLVAMGRHGHPGWADVLGSLGRSGLGGGGVTVSGHLRVVTPQSAERAASMPAPSGPSYDELAGVIGAVRRVGGRRFLPLLIDRLRVRHGRDLVRDAIVAMGESVLVELAAALANPSTDRLVRRHLPRTISRFRSQRAADLLLATIEDDPDGFVRYKALRGLGRLVVESSVRVERLRVERLIEKNLLEYLRLTSISVALLPGLAKAPAVARPSGEVLAGLLEDKRAQSLERAFRLLQIAHRREDVHSSALAVSSGDKQLRAQALEYLDAMTLTSEVREVRDLFRLVADDLSDAERVRRAAAFVPEAPASFEAALAQLLEDKDDSVVGIAAHFALEHGLEELPLQTAAGAPAGEAARKVPALAALVRRLEAAAEGLPGVT
jgi:ATP:ADP antiporter, AAA family